MSDIFCGAHAQADDLALLSISKAGLQKMMDYCYEFSCRWRFLIHPRKSKVLIWRDASKGNLKYDFEIGNNEVAVVKSETHCGIRLSTGSTIERTKLACRKGRGVMMSICNDWFAR